MRSEERCSMSKSPQPFQNEFDLSPRLTRMTNTKPVVEFGIVDKVVASTIEAHGPNVTVGSLCWLVQEDRRVPLEVIGFTAGKVILMLLAKLDGIRRGDVIQSAGRVASIGISPKLCGHVVDCMGRPIDDFPIP